MAWLMVGTVTAGVLWYIDPVAFLLGALIVAAVAGAEAPP